MAQTAVILGAGRGARLGSITDEPKCLLRIAGQTLLGRHLNLLEELGVETAVLVVGYRQEMIRDHVQSLQPGLEIRYVENVEYETKGNGYSLYQGLAAATGPTLTIDGDLIYTRDILAGFLSNGHTDAVLVGPGSLDDIECAKALVDPDRRVRNLIDKRAVRPDDAGQFLGEAIGLMIFSESARRALVSCAEEFFSHPDHLILNWEHLLNVYLREGRMMAHFNDSDQWIEIDTPEDFATAQQKFEASGGPRG